MNAQLAVLQKDITPADDDYDVVRRCIEKISLDYRDQPSLETLAEEVGETPTGLQKLFTRWAGLSPKGFLQAVTLDHAPAPARGKELRRDLITVGVGDDPNQVGRLRG